MRKATLAATAACLLVSFASVASAQTSLNILGQNLSWDRSAAPLLSPTMTIGINRTSADPQADLFAGWSLRLSIVPDAGATGTLEFNSATLPGVDYPLAGVSGGLGGSVSGTTLFAFDDDTSFAGVTLSTAGDNLLDLDFSTPDGALGLFRIMATPGLGDTQWSDAAFNDQEFANLPFAGGPVEIATVTAVPEPGSLLFCSLATLLGLAFYVRRRSRAHDNCCRIANRRRLSFRESHGRATLR
jgi:hypothetical protein